jgi:hypothetical protein
MSYSAIDCKEEKHSFGLWPLTESVSTTLCIVNMGSSNMGLTYDASFSGIKSGHVKGGPYEVDGDMEKEVNANPRVMLYVSNFNKGRSYVSMHVKITVDIPVVGTETIYDQTLGGNYSVETGWAELLERFGEKVRQNSKHFADATSGLGMR